MRTRESEEMYLETILVLKKKNPCVRSIDVAMELNYSRPSVSRGVKLLQQKGFLRIEKSGELTLTKAGEAKATNIYERHQILTKLLLKTGVEQKLAEENACRIEHVISEELFEALKKYSEKE
jgi:Mn-dependent DtxR family transcriptional regulator